MPFRCLLEKIFSKKALDSRSLLCYSEKFRLKKRKDEDIIKDMKSPTKSSRKEPVMKKILALVTFLAFSIISCSTGNSIDVKTAKQETDYTCWIASLRMVANQYKSYDFQECALIGTINSVYGLPGECCGVLSDEPETVALPISDVEAVDSDGDGITDRMQQSILTIQVPNQTKRYCQRGGSQTDIFIALELILKVKYQAYERAMTFEEIKKAVDQGFLILVGRSYLQGSFGHMHVITGYDNASTSIQVSEVTFGFKYMVPYNKFSSSIAQGVWNYSFVIMEEKQYEPICADVFGAIRCVPNPESLTLVQKVREFFRLEPR
jgi:hypothetical protein